MPSPKIGSFIRLFNSPARPPVGGDRSSESHPGIHLGIGVALGMRQVTLESSRSLVVIRRIGYRRQR